MGIILGVAVLLDAALVRLLLVPVLPRLMGCCVLSVYISSHQQAPQASNDRPDSP